MLDCRPGHRWTPEETKLGTWAWASLSSYLVQTHPLQMVGWGKQDQQECIAVLVLRQGQALGETAFYSVGNGLYRTTATFLLLAWA